jgi:hypothetical protein
MNKYKIISQGWEFRRWSLHDSDDIFVVKVSNGENTCEFSGLNEARTILDAERYIEEKNNKEIIECHDIGCWD